MLQVELKVKTFWWIYLLIKYVYAPILEQFLLHDTKTFSIIKMNMKKFQRILIFLLNF